MRTLARLNRRSKTCLGLRSRSTTAVSPGRCGSATRPWISSTSSAAGCAAEEQAKGGDRWSATPQAGSRRCRDNLSWDEMARAGEGYAVTRLHGDASLCSSRHLASGENICRTKGSLERPTREEKGRMARYRFHCTNGSECFFDARGTDIRVPARLAMRAQQVAREVMRTRVEAADWSDWRVAVCDLKGRRVLLQPFRSDSLTLGLSRPA